MSDIEAITKERFDAYFELGFSPNTGLISTVRRFVSDFYERVLENAALAARMSLAAHELLENAVTNSTDGHSVIRIGVRRRDGALEVAIDTKNHARPEHAAALKANIDEMAAAGDVAEHYQKLMRRSAKRTEGSGLGLGRVAAEAEMRLFCEIEGEVVHVRARATYPLSAVA